MRVILFKDVDKVGKAGEIKDVADGYGRNFLLRNKLAELATDLAIKYLELKKQQTQELKDKEQKKLQKFINSLQGVRAVIKAKASAQGKLFGSIGAKEIIEAIKGTRDTDNTECCVQHSVLRPEHIVLGHPIKQIGETEVAVRLGSGKEAKIKVVVEKI